MEQEVFRCKGMMERGLNANYLMIADYTRDLKVDGMSMKDIVFSLNEQINFLHSQINDLQSQVFEYEARFKAHPDSYSGPVL
ncbi:40S ribosomal protein S5-1 [Hordeum vulgare]|nr:40S ribosomal protein S5-1 [Hordeum vulgare]